MAKEQESAREISSRHPSGGVNVTLLIPPRQRRTVTFTLGLGCPEAQGAPYHGTLVLPPGSPHKSLPEVRHDSPGGVVRKRRIGCLREPRKRLLIPGIEPV